jgi:hypothetical protein
MNWHGLVSPTPLKEGNFVLFHIYYLLTARHFWQFGIRIINLLSFLLYLVDRKWEGSFTMVFGRWILLNATVLPYPKHTHPCSYFPESWLWSNLPLSLRFLMDSPMMCSSVSGALTLAMVLPEISTDHYVTVESTPSLMIESFMEVTKSHHHL